MVVMFAGKARHLTALSVVSHCIEMIGKTTIFLNVLCAVSDSLRRRNNNELDGGCKR
jgi:hypothetical protein